MSAPVSTIDTICADFAFLDEWEDRYRYVIELGHTLEPLPPESHNETTRVRGCVSQVWLECETPTNAAGCGGPAGWVPKWLTRPKPRPGSGSISINPTGFLPLA